MLFLVDANLPPVLAAALIEAGHRAQHVEEAGLRNAEDDEIWDYAIAQDAIVVTKDEDFPYRFARSSKTPIIFWLRIGNCRNAELLNWFLPLLPDVIERIQSGDRLIEAS